MRVCVGVCVLLVLLDPPTSLHDVADSLAHSPQDVVGAWEPYQLKAPRAAARALAYHNGWWLIQKWVNFLTDARNFLFAGRTGTRLSIGRTQMRWEANCETAAQMLGHRISNERGLNMRSVGIIFCENLAVHGLIQCFV